MAENGGISHLSEFLDDRIGTHVRRITRLLIDTKAAALQPLGITVPQYSTLLSIKHLEPSSAAQLSRTGLGTPQSIATMLSTLEGKGLISRQASPMHQKLVEVRLTRLGEKTVDEADQLAAGIEADLRKAIGEEHFNSIIAIERVAKELFQK
ncbi:MarR family winged helix-turn-helix transcriptional regulator [Rhodococcus sp. 1168]|uniref:MarR family winged helix-turn-helix transcriptional regulator n=1 Tax=Rhodococcus sp. 1168 TaxID=2018041 RepID=UPI000A0D6D6B|nr:MarR family transcriptional regulator [Rhodococcus sp. 1168]ORI17285.1 MarR family transcriptional regulator [Rhodococcus sp. 1168]